MERIAVTKMNILSRLMFLFQSIPIIKKASILASWQKHLIKFVWAGKKVRIKAKCLCDLKERGGERRVTTPKFKNLS